jgi:hypothetical protein
MVNLSDYLPTGSLEITLCGKSGGESFDIGIGQDANRRVAGVGGTHLPGPKDNHHPPTPDLP